MSIFNGLAINTSGLALERMKLDTISTNIANVNTTRTAEGGPYKSKTVTFAENVKNIQNQGLNNITNYTGNMSYGVKVTGIRQDNTVKRTYDPSNPDANAQGYVRQSNVNMADQMIQMVQTMRTYEANVSATEANKALLKNALSISKN